MKRNRVLSAIAFMALGGSAAANTLPSEPDVIITGASIVTMGPQGQAQAIAIKGDHIVGVGSNAEISAMKGSKTKIIDASGKTIVPGLQDSHIHPASLGHDVAYTADLLRMTSGAEMAEALAGLKPKLAGKPDAWLVGARWDASKFEKLFTRWDIDGATGDMPAYLTAYRRLGVNTAVFEKMGIKESDPSTWPAWWLEDPENFTAEDTIYRAPRQITVDGKEQTYNVPTGVFIGSEAVALVTARPPRLTPAEEAESAGLGSHELNKVGLTSVIIPGNNFGDVTLAYQMARDQGNLSVRVTTYEGIFFQQSPEWIEDLLGKVGVNNLGDDWVRLRGTKIYADGGPSARGSWVSEPYHEEHAGDAPDFGVPVVESYEDREAQFRAILKHGWELHTHSTGDAAMLQDTRLYKKLLDEMGLQLPNTTQRWSIEHANMPLEQREVLDTMAQYGIIASIQPVMISDLGHAWSLNIGKDRLARSLPAASYMKAGVTVVSGSDYGVTPYDPWLGMYGLVTRKDSSTGEVYGASERIGLIDALKTYTINGAYAAYAEDKWGSLEVGKYADLVVVDIDDLAKVEADPELLKTMSDRVLATMVGGEVRYEKPGSAMFGAAN